MKENPQDIILNSDLFSNVSWEKKGIQDKHLSIFKEPFQNEFPSSKNESFKYFPVHLLKDKKFALSQKTTSASLNIEPLENQNSYKLLIYNGYLLEDKIPTAISDCLEISYDSSLKNLNTLPLFHTDYFKNITLNSFQEKIHLQIKKPLLKRLDIVLINDRPEEITLPFISITVEPSIQLQLSTSYLSQTKQEKEHLNLPYFQIYLKEKSIVEYYDFNSSSALYHNFISIDVYQEKESTFDYALTHFGEALNRYALRVYLLDKEARCNLIGSYYTQNKEKIDCFIRIYHLHANTYSNQFFKGISKGASTFIFDGDVFVEKDSTDVEADQLSKNIMLHRNAKVYARPQLHVNHHQLRCSHGATIGQINDEELFYLQTRGIDQKQAQNLVTLSFIKEIILLIKDQEWQELILKIFTSLLKED